MEFRLLSLPVKKNKKVLEEELKEELEEKHKKVLVAVVRFQAAMPVVKFLKNQKVVLEERARGMFLKTVLKLYSS